ncbi:hypothetical protein DQ237_02405 [Blastococcus sp. TF02-8]|uniref:hypothetical protein n=1 Tax=Blastococcus sp. TF02-8 TaxID=2250574 RepID=UPI000DEBEC1E|nr:hypothetical protein [Blastococcus sp. TF02-8]RBY97784.1 hypothetical protein DQ237_02405 [Blastococcus sp. TF02-8]
MKDVVAVLGGVLGAVAFFGNVGLSLIAHTHMELTLEWLERGKRSVLTALTTVENRGRFPKRIHYLCLVVGPAGESLPQMLAALGDAGRTSASGGRLDALVRARADEEDYAPDGAHALLPLPFVYRDQPSIGQEAVSFRSVIDTARLASAADLRVYLVAASRYPLGVLRYRTTAELAIHEPG